MPAKTTYLLLFLALPFWVTAGGIRDSIFELPVVEVRDLRQQRVAGMKHIGIDSLVISEKQHLSLAQILSEHTPVFVKEYGRGALATASFRGTSPSHTGLNWNGVPVSDPMSGMADLSLIPAFIIDDVNLQFGSASVSDQSGGLGGSIRLRNQADWNNRLSISYTQGLGSFRTFEEYLGLAAGNDRFQYRIRLYHKQSENDYTFLNRSRVYSDGDNFVHPLDTLKNAGYKQFGFLQEVYYRPDDRNIVSFHWWSQWNDRGLPHVASYEGPASALLSNQEDADHRFVGSWSRYIDNGRLHARSAYSNKKLDYVVQNRMGADHYIPLIVSESKQHQLLQHLSYQQDLWLDILMDHSLDLSYNRVSNYESVLGTGYDKDRLVYAYVLGLQKSFWDRFDMNLVFRQEWTNHERDPIVPFLGFNIFPLQSRDLVLHANAARNFRRASLNELFWQPGGNPDLLPEEGILLEAGMNYSTGIRSFNIQCDISFYHTDVNDWIIWIPAYQGFWKPMNIKRVRSQGIELSLRLDGHFAGFDLFMMGGYAYTPSKNLGDPVVWGDESYGKQLVYIPLHSGNMLFNVKRNNWSFSWYYNAYSERFTTTANSITNRDRLYPYYMNDISISKQINTGRLQIIAEIKVNNLFDEAYHTVLYRPMPGRHYLLIVTVNGKR